MRSERRTFQRPSPLIALIAAYALFFASYQAPVRNLAADPPGSEVVEKIGWVTGILNTLTSGLDDQQLYNFGNVLFLGAGLAALGSAYTWRQTYGSPVWRSYRSGESIPILEQAIKTVRAADVRTYEDARKQMRLHIRSIPPGVPHRQEILRLLNEKDEEAVDRLLIKNLPVQEAIRNHALGKEWLLKFTEHRSVVGAAKLVEFNAKGVQFSEANQRIVNFIKTASLPKGLPFQAEFRAIDTPEKLTAWLEKPQVVTFLSSEDAKVHEWQQKLVDLIDVEDTAYAAMKEHYDRLAKGVMEKLAEVDAKGQGIVFIEGLVQPEMRFEMERYKSEGFGTFHTLNNGGWGPTTNGQRAHQTLIHFDKALRDAHEKARKEHLKACHQRYWAFVFGGGALLLTAAGWKMRSMGNQRLEARTGKSGDTAVVENKQKATEEGQAKAKDATTPLAVSKRLAEARKDPLETELRAYYTLLRDTMRKPENLPVIAKVIAGSKLVSQTDLDIAKFDERLNEFMKDNDAADAVIDAAIASATNTNASSVPAIKELLFGNDKSREPFQIEVHKVMHPAIVRALWPTVVVDPTVFNIDEKIFSKMRADTAPELEAISGRYRARPVAMAKPTEAFPSGSGGR